VGADGCYVYRGVLGKPFNAMAGHGGISLIILGTCVAVKSLHDNPFFRGDLIAPPYRVTTGLYQYFDHPGYLGFSIRYLGFALIGDNAVSGALFFLYLLFLVIRAEIDGFLLADL